MVFQRELDIFPLRLREHLAFGKEVFLGMGEISGTSRRMQQSRLCGTAATTFRRYPGRLSLAGCSSAEPACVSPANSIVIISSVIVKSFITMLCVSLCVLLWPRRVWHHDQPGSFRLGRRACPWVLYSRSHCANAWYCNDPRNRPRCF